MTWAASSVRGKARNWKVQVERMAMLRRKKQMYVNDILYSRAKDRFVNILSDFCINSIQTNARTAQNAFIRHPFQISARYPGKILHRVSLVYDLPIHC